MHSFYHSLNKIGNTIFLLFLNCIISCFHSTTIFGQLILKLQGNQYIFNITFKIEGGIVFSI